MSLCLSVCLSVSVCFIGALFTINIPYPLSLSLGLSLSLYLSLISVARSPLYSHISLTLQGLSTIRSYSMQSEALKQFHNFHNQHTQAWYLYIVTVR